MGREDNRNANPSNLFPNKCIQFAKSLGSDIWAGHEFYCCHYVVLRPWGSHITCPNVSLFFKWERNPALPPPVFSEQHKTKPTKDYLTHPAQRIPLCKPRLYFRACMFVFVFGPFLLPEHISLNRSNLFPEKWTFYGNRKPLFAGACAPALSVAPLGPLVTTPIPRSHHTPEESNPRPDSGQAFLSFFPPPEILLTSFIHFHEVQETALNNRKAGI